MPTPCNIRYHQLKQLIAEFAALKGAGDVARLQELAKEIRTLGAEFNMRHAESERLLAKENG